jgi:hypothetical protein
VCLADTGVYAELAKESKALPGRLENWEACSIDEKAGLLSNVAQFCAIYIDKVAHGVPTTLWFKWCMMCIHELPGKEEIYLPVKDEGPRHPQPMGDVHSE